MRHYDYDWDLHDWGIKFDNELDIDKLGWKSGDYFRIENVNGQAMLVKCHPLVKFLKDGAKKNEQMGTMVRESTESY
jgi:anaerobic selenocysteine-containing dehydrogenase